MKNGKVRVLSLLLGKELEDAVCEIIYKANESILIVSPYIKLDKYFEKLFEQHIDNYKIQITIVFGKNEGNVTKSLSIRDFEFFKKFHDITIVYVPTLHAKYYSNEKVGLITSINLHEYSVKHNIEYGVLFDTSFLSRADKTDLEAWQFSNNLANENDVIYIKRAIIEKKRLSQNFIGSKVLFDVTDSLIRNRKYESKRISDFPNFIEESKKKSKVRPTRAEVESTVENEKTIVKANTKKGFCIRCGIDEYFNILSPLCTDCWKKWVHYEDKNFREKYCHNCGEKRITSMAQPICYSCR